MSKKPFIRSSFIPKKLFIIYVDGGHNSMTKDEAWGSVVDQNGKDLVNNNLLELQKNSSTSVVDNLIIRSETLPVGDRNIIVSKFNDVVSQQNNGAELLAFYAGLLIMLDKKDDKKNNTNCIIYSDSQLIVDYWGKGHVSASKLKKIDPKKLAYIKECGKLRTIFEQQGGKIIKISGDNNKADLGYH